MNKKPTAFPGVVLRNFSGIADHSWWCNIHWKIKARINKGKTSKDKTGTSPINSDKPTAQEVNVIGTVGLIALFIYLISASFKFFLGKRQRELLNP